MVKGNPVELDRLFEQGLDGKPTTMSGNAVEVAQRPPAGHWLFATDVPFGVDAAA